MAAEEVKIRRDRAQRLRQLVIDRGSPVRIDNTGVEWSTVDGQWFYFDHSSHWGDIRGDWIPGIPPGEIE